MLDDILRMVSRKETFHCYVFPFLQNYLKTFLLFKKKVFFGKKKQDEIEKIMIYCRLHLL